MADTSQDLTFTAFRLIKCCSSRLYTLQT
ncbi:BnaCnng26990D [Brassica napus]|uniref:BnaCnng26990D protein n=1 Tax=Brassica napus TaxID=3708 RepID=A0A078IZ67_BRANA|nr:BnaCnng26990D [Brassica napus]